ncbi:lantibiotic dehydratase family protein [Galbibacter sp. BG1]|uniref:lantibiotic dehydratase family protein n=1 Tax=Galbibacter sp. BG1 TaxID=1170699 RepID=UPI0015B87CFF|nr:lantibiotic dehydratase family protein [Galbibacter sp. BG1]QLE00947.1 lantibiotic dehydratase family protein [Galbibacter sp. BG1]
MPALPLNFILNLFSTQKISDSVLLNAIDNKEIKDALFLASPSFFQEIEVCIKNGGFQKKRKVKTSLIRYLSRMCLRSTPFGLFAGCTIGEFDTSTSLLYTKENYRKTKLDSLLIFKLTQNLLKDSELNDNIMWFPNSSMYSVGDQLRYIQYGYSNGKRFYGIEAIKKNPYLKQILKKSAQGIKLNDFVNFLVNKGFCQIESKEFFDKLISNQILVSEYEPALIGESLEEKLFEITKGQNLNSGFKEIAKINKILLHLNETSSNYIDSHEIINKSLKKLGLKTQKNLFQVDLFMNIPNATINQKWKSKFKKLIPFLSKISKTKSSVQLKVFKEAFLKRYNSQEVPLAEVLDVEIGIGYPIQEINKEEAYIMDNLSICSQFKKTEQTLLWNEVTQILNSKLQDHNGFILELKDEDFTTIYSHNYNLPKTMYALTELLNISNEEKLFVGAIGGSSAANLISRFHHGDDRIKDHILKITDTEATLNSNKIIAEITHLPEERTGNILHRPKKIRAYEFPYLAHSNLEKDFQIPLNDLMISIKNNTILLRSKRIGKEVIPMLTTAHNFKTSTLPIYKFLCELNLQDTSNNISFEWGCLKRIYRFLPRVIYKDFILSKARWIFDSKGFTDYYSTLNEDKLLEALEIWRLKYKIPKWIQLVEGDNILVLNLTNVDCVHTLLEMVRGKGDFVIEESLIKHHKIIKNRQDENYTNQMIFSFYKSQK